MDMSDRPLKRPKVGEQHAVFLVTRHSPKQPDASAQTYDNGVSGLPDLPTEILFAIFHRSLNPCLVHVCRALRLKLPAYAGFCKALTSMVLYMKPHIVDGKLRKLMDSYWELRHLPKPSTQQLDELRWIAMCSPWFSMSRLEAAHADIQREFQHEYDTEVFEYLQNVFKAGTARMELQRPPRDNSLYSRLRRSMSNRCFPSNPCLRKVSCLMPSIAPSL